MHYHANYPIAYALSILIGGFALFWVLRSLEWYRTTSRD